MNALTIVVLAFAILFAGCLETSVPSNNSPAPISATPTAGLQVKLSMDFSSQSDLSKIIPDKGTWTIEDGQLKSVGTETAPAYAEVYSGSLTNPKVTVTVKPSNLKIEGPEILLISGNNRYTCYYREDSGYLRLTKNFVVYKTVSINLQPGDTLPMSIQIEKGPGSTDETITCRLGSATVSDFFGSQLPIDKVALGGYRVDEGGYWDDLKIEAS